MNCGEVREIAAHGLCFACYRREVRAETKTVDPHTPNRERKANSTKMLKSYGAMMQSLVELGVGLSDIATVRNVMRPYMTAIWHLIGEYDSEGGEGTGHVT